MLYAASPRGNGKGIEWVLLAVDNLKKDKKNPDAPGWHSAARYVAGQPLFRNALLRTLAMDAKSTRQHRLDDAQSRHPVDAVGAARHDRTDHSTNRFWPSPMPRCSSWHRPKDRSPAQRSPCLRIWCAVGGPRPPAKKCCTGC